MKRKKDPVLAKVRRMADTLGPMVPDFAYRYDEARRAYVCTFTMLSIRESEQLEAEEFELTAEQAYWYFAGAVNGSMWTVNITRMGDARRAVASRPRGSAR